MVNEFRRVFTDGRPHPSDEWMTKEWLGYSRAAVEVVNAKGEGLSDDERMKMLLEQNVVLQLQHLKTHPKVATAIATNKVQLHGWVYDIKTGDVHAYDEAQNKFLPVEDRYAAEMAKHATGGCAA